MESAEHSPQPHFWKEMYWFIVISLVGIAVALVLVSPRANRLHRLRQLEASLEVRQAALERQERLLEAAIDSFESDPFYRDVVYRKILGVKKNSEEFLNLPRSAVR